MAKRSINEILEKGVLVNVDIPLMVESLREARTVLRGIVVYHPTAPAVELLKKWDEHE